MVQKTIQKKRTHRARFVLYKLNIINVIQPSISLHPLLTYIRFLQL